MTFPNIKGKHKHNSMVSPKDFIKYKKWLRQFPSGNPPEGVIICYHKPLFKRIISRHKTKKSPFWTGELHFLKETKNKLAIVGKFGIGSPVAAITLEELIAFGVKKFITVGTAGTLSKELKVGDIVLCNKSVRDEGTSHHYIKYAKYAYPSDKMLKKLKKYMDENKIKYFLGPSWTIDAPYRETVEEARHYQNEGVLVVEMEASALFSVAQVRNVEIAALFAISDSLAELKWKPKFHSKKLQKSVENLYEIARDILMA